MSTFVTPEVGDLTLGRRLTEITLGIDALERVTGHDNATISSGGFVPIYLGQAVVAPAQFASYSEADAALDAFAADVSELAPSPRATFLQAMLRALRVAVRLFAGDRVRFEQKLTDLVGVPAELVPEETIAAIHEQLDRLIAARGYVDGSLAQRVRAWQTGRFLDSGDIPEIFAQLMAEAKRRTDAMIWDTGDYTMRLNAVRNVPYAGRCSFTEGNMDINLDVRVTRSSLKHLVAHEVFPGHSTQLLSTRALVERGEATADALLCTANVVTGAVQEGIGDQGIELIDWVEDEDDAAQIELRRLQTATGSNAALQLHTGGWTNAESVRYLCDVGFGQESWANVRTQMALEPFQGAFLASYWFGNETVRALRLRGGETRAALIDQLYAHVHSVASLTEALA